MYLGTKRESKDVAIIQITVSLNKLILLST